VSYRHTAVNFKKGPLSRFNQHTPAAAKIAGRLFQGNLTGRKAYDHPGKIAQTSKKIAIVRAIIVLIISYIKNQE
jgi:hypothetical protein